MLVLVWVYHPRDGDVVIAKKSKTEAPKISTPPAFCTHHAHPRRSTPPAPDTGLETEEDDNLFEQLGISRSVVETYTTKDGLPKASGVVAGAGSLESDARDASDKAASSAAAVAAATATAKAVAAAAAEAGGAPVLSGADPAAAGDHAEDAVVDAQVAEVGAEGVSAEEAASAAEVEAKSKALAAAAALEAAVASGDVVYPKNDDTEAVGEEGEGGGEGSEGGPGEAGEELAASIGSTEVF